MDKKGYSGDWVDVGGFILILVVISGGIIGAYANFFHSKYDFREAEADLLFNAVADCFYESENDFFDAGFDVFEACGIMDNVEKKHLIYVKEIGSEKKPFFVGVLDYKIQCDLIDKKNEFAKCRKEVIKKGGKDFEIVVGSNQESIRIAK